MSGKRTFPCQIGPLTVHCSGLGGGLLSPEHEYDIFFQNHAQMKVYGPSLAMTDDWEQRITQLGLTKTTHEYAIYQLFSTGPGMECVEGVPSGQIRQSQAPYITRAIRLLTAATDPASACKTTTSHMGHCCSSDLPVLSSSGQTFVFASLLSAVCDCTRSRGY